MEFKAPVDLPRENHPTEPVDITGQSLNPKSRNQTFRLSTERQRMRILHFNNDEIRLLLLQAERAYLRDVSLIPTVKSLKDRVRTMMAVRK